MHANDYVALIGESPDAGDARAALCVTDLGEAVTLGGALSYLFVAVGGPGAGPSTVGPPGTNEITTLFR
jgi:hypothetical protein